MAMPVAPSALLLCDPHHGHAVDTPPQLCHSAPCSPLGTLWAGQDSIRQRHLGTVCARLAVVERAVGKEDIVVHTAEQEGGEDDHEEELPGEAEGSAPKLSPQLGCQGQDGTPNPQGRTLR